MLQLGIRYQAAGDYEIDIGKLLIARFAPNRKGRELSVFEANSEFWMYHHSVPNPVFGRPRVRGGLQPAFCTVGQFALNQTKRFYPTLAHFPLPIRLGLVGAHVPEELVPRGGLAPRRRRFIGSEMKWAAAHPSGAVSATIPTTQTAIC
jgi:hypothetical protein